MGQTVTGVVGRLAKAFAVRDAIELGDAELIARFQASADATAFEAIVRRHGPMVLGVCQRLLRNPADADDAFQATFAILIRKAGSLSRPERLAGWLFQVAYRTAKRARAVRLRRASNQSELPDIPVESPVAEIVWRELRPIFDEEVNRLPDKLRLPVVMCFLEGQTKRAAAQSLGWPEGTFSCRLQQARQLLQGRLSRRGVTLSAGALAAALFEGTASAAISPALITTAVQSITLIAAGSALTAPVAALTQGVLHSMLITKMKIVAAMIVTVGIFGGGTGWVLKSGTGDPSGALAAEPGAKPKDKNTPAKATDPRDLLKEARDRAAIEEELSELRKLLGRRDQLLAQQREIDDQITQLKLEAERRAREKKLANVGSDEGIDLRSKEQQSEIERLKKLVADLQAQNAQLRKLEADQRREADAQRDQALEKEKLATQNAVLAERKALEQERLAKQKAELAAAEAELKVQQDRLARMELLAKEKAVTQMQVDEVRAEWERARAIVEKLKAIQSDPRGGGRLLGERLERTDVRIAEAELRQSEATLQAAEAKLQVQLAELAQTEKLVAAKIVSTSERDKIAGGVAIAKAEVAHAQASLERAKAIVALAKQQQELKSTPAIPKVPANWSREAELEKILKLIATGSGSDAAADKKEIDAATARIRTELEMLVMLRVREMVRAKQQLDARKISEADYKKAVEAVDAASRLQSQLK